MSVKDDIDAAYVNTMYRAQLRIAIRDEVFAEVRSRTLDEAKNLIENVRGTWQPSWDNLLRHQYALTSALLQEISDAEREGRPMSARNVDEIVAGYLR